MPLGAFKVSTPSFCAEFSIRWFRGFSAKIELFHFQNILIYRGCTLKLSRFSAEKWAIFLNTFYQYSSLNFFSRPCASHVINIVIEILISGILKFLRYSIGKSYTVIRSRDGGLLGLFLVKLNSEPDHFWPIEDSLIIKNCLLDTLALKTPFLRWFIFSVISSPLNINLTNFLLH